jgi:hypothetical protein
MTEEQMPGDNPEDRELRRRWQRQSDELPGEALDDTIRAAARRDLGSSAASRATAGRSHGRAPPRWMRFAPLAAAASVAVLAVGLVRLMPRDEYGLPAATEPRAPVVEAPAPQHSEAAADSEMPAADLPFVADEPVREPATKPPAPRAPVGQVEPVEIPASGALESTTTARSRTARPPQTSDATATAAGVERGAAVEEVDAQAQSNAKRAASRAGELRAAAPESALLSAPEDPVVVPSELASLLRADAAKRSGVAVEAIRIVSAYSVTWPDGSMGCGEPGELATQALVPGYVVEVDAAGTHLRYHTDRGSRFRLCADD